jgi:hypothetical protein
MATYIFDDRKAASKVGVAMQGLAAAAAQTAETV